MPGLSLGAWPFILLLVLLPIGWAALQKRRVRLPLPGIGEAARHGVGRGSDDVSQRPADERIVACVVGVAAAG